MVPPTPSLPAPPVASGAFSAATVASGPQPASAVAPQQPVMLPPLHYQGMGAPQPFGYQPAVASGLPPTRMAALAAANSALQAGMVRTADQMEGETPGELPPAKRQKVAKLPGGALYSEEDWIAMHPVSTCTWLICTAHSREFSTPYLFKSSCLTILQNPSGSCKVRSLRYPTSP